MADGGLSKAKILLLAQARARQNGSPQASGPSFPEIPTAADIPVQGETLAAAQRNPSFIQKALASMKASPLNVSQIPQELDTSMKRAIINAGVNTIAGAGQLINWPAKKTGLTPQGYHQRIGDGAESLREQLLQPYQQGSRFAPLEPGMQTITEMLPWLMADLSKGTGIAKLLSRPPAQQAPGLVGQSLTSGAGMAGMGATAYHPGEKEPLSAGRAIGTGAGALLGTALPFVGGAIGRGIGAITEAGARYKIKQGLTQPDPAKYLPAKENQTPLAVRQAVAEKKGMAAIEESGRLARERGIYTDPGAPDNLAVLSERGRVRFPNEMDRVRVEKLLNRSTEGAQRTMAEFYRDILPEGSPSKVQAMVSKAFEKMKKTPMPIEGRGAIFADPGYQWAIKQIAKNKLAASKLTEYDPNQFGRLDVVRKTVNDEINRIQTQKETKAVDSTALEVLKETKDKIMGFMESASPEYRKAIELSHREHIVRRFAKEFGFKKNHADEVQNIPAEDIYNTFFKSQKSYNALLDELRAIKNPNVKTKALEKASLMRDILGKFTTTKDTYLQAVQGEAKPFEARSRWEAAGGYTALDYLKAHNNRAILDYVLDGQASPDMARKVMAATSPGDFGFNLARLLATASSNTISKELGETKEWNR